MTEQQFTLQDIHNICESDQDRIRFGMILAPSHEERIIHVEAAINWIVQEHTKTRHLRQNRNEDELTIDIVTELRALGFQASHDTQYGGHCDIVIEARDNFLWIAEAKIHGAYDWLLKGFQQLSTRYSTGLPGQDHGALIIYCKEGNANEIMNKWAQHLSDQMPDVQTVVCSKNPLHRRSSHQHANSGLNFQTWHVAVPLFFKPKDKAN